MHPPGRLHIGCPCLSLPSVLPINTEGGEHKRVDERVKRPKERKKIRPEEEERKEEQEKEKQKKKQRENRGRQRGKKPSTTTDSSAAWNHRHQRAPPWTSTAATADQFPHLSLLPSSPSLLRVLLLSFACRTWAIHVLQQMKIISWLLCYAQ